MFDNLIWRDKVDYALNFRGYPPFHPFVYLGKTDLLRLYFSNPSMLRLLNVKLRAQGSQTPLHVACMGSANVETVALMLQYGASVFATDDYGRMPIHIAANAGQTDIFKLLLKNMGEKNIAKTHQALLTLDRNKRSVLHAVCMSGSSAKEKRRGLELVDTLRAILDCYAASERLDALQQVDRYQVSPLMYAKHYKLDEILQYAQRLGQDLAAIPDIPKDCPAAVFDYWGRTKLQEAAFDSDLYTVQRMLRRSSNHPMIGNPQFSNINALHYAVLNGNSEAVRMILNDIRTNPLSVDNEGRTALHFAATRGDSRILEVLLQNWSILNNVNAKDRYGMTALHAVAMNSNANVAKIEDRLVCVQKLKDAGAAMLAINNNGDTPYEVANKCSNYPVAMRLMQLEPRMRQRRQPDPYQMRARLFPEVIKDLRLDENEFVYRRAKI